MDENDWLEFNILLLCLSLKYLQNLLYCGKIMALCLWHLLWNQHQAMSVVCHLYSVWIQYRMYSICIIVRKALITAVLVVPVIYVGFVFCCFYCRWECVSQRNLLDILPLLFQVVFFTLLDCILMMAFFHDGINHSL